ncbi:HCCA isomerase/glutathione S-transferase kappa [Thozetella sp. PMI_491]|nr:HCCA isomerase/glutathione S-transferase kappa [Thozetella sp. PMI_491]
MTPKITLYLDTVSPFAYEAYHILRHDATFSGCHVTYVPIFLGGLMNMCRNTPPIQIKNKDKWIDVERLRWARAFSVPMAATMPPEFPPLTLGIMRALATVAYADGDDQGRLTKALDVLFSKYWVEQAPTYRPEVLRSILLGLFGEHEADKLLADAASVGKKQLLENTSKAFDNGAFGLPWFVCTNSDGKTEGFWGVDHIGQVVEYLGLSRPGQSGWRAVL